MKGRNRLALSLLALTAILPLGACGERGTPEDRILASFDGGVVDRDELDAHVLSLPLQERRPTDGDFASWYGEIVRRLALEEILFDEALASGITDSPEVAQRVSEAMRQTVVGACMADSAGSPAAPTEDEIEAAFAEWRPEYEQPDRRQLFHIFRRLDDETDSERAMADLLELRERTLAGESFPALAAEHSDSESRHRKGAMGWFSRGQLPTSLEEIVFALPERQPSEPVRTSTGLHMFWVESLSPAASPSLEQLRPAITGRLMSERRLEQARQLVEIEEPAGSVIPDPDDLAALLSTGDRALLILKVGDFELRLGDLQQRAAASGIRTVEAVASLIDSLRIRELLYLQCVERGSAERPQVVARLERINGEASVDVYIRERLLAEITERREEMIAFFERNLQRYSEPARLRLTRLIVPLGSDPSARMGELERARQALDGGEITFEDLARQLEGAAEDLGWKRLSELQSDSGAMAILAARLEPGEHSPPYLRGSSAELLRLEDRKEPVALPLARVEDRVAEDLLTHRGQELFAGYSEKVLAEHRFELNERLLEQLTG